MNYTACLAGSHIASLAARAGNSFHDWVTMGLASFAWMREIAHWADSATTGSGEAASLFNTVDILRKAAKAGGNFAFPSAMQTLRMSPCHFVLLIGLPRNISVKSLGLSDASHSRRGINSASLEPSLSPCRRNSASAEGSGAGPKERG